MADLGVLGSGNMRNVVGIVLPKADDARDVQTVAKGLGEIEAGSLTSQSPLTRALVA